MTTNVNERCRAIATLRHVVVRLMEIVARWTPITPEMEAKVVFGRHIWDFAQMADWLGKRTFELRQPLHHTLRPVAVYEDLLRDVAATQSTAERLAALYEGMLPGLVERCRAYVAATDPILDEPSVVIIERMIRELERQRVEGSALQRELNLGPAYGSGFAERERAIGSIVAETAPA